VRWPSGYCILDQRSHKAFWTAEANFPLTSIIWFGWWCQVYLLLLPLCLLTLMSVSLQTDRSQDFKFHWLRYQSVFFLPYCSASLSFYSNVHTFTFFHVALQSPLLRPSKNFIQISLHLFVDLLLFIADFAVSCCVISKLYDSWSPGRHRRPMDDVILSICRNRHQLLILSYQPIKMRAAEWKSVSSFA
jgi:hypothetical protein